MLLDVQRRRMPKNRKTTGNRNPVVESRRNGRSNSAASAAATRRFTPLRACLQNLKQLPTVSEWDRLLMEEATRRFSTKTESAAALGLTREGYRRKLLRMGLD